MSDEVLTQATLSQQYKCFSCLSRRPKRQTGINRFTSQVFPDKSSFRLSRQTLDSVFVSFQLPSLVHTHMHAFYLFQHPKFREPTLGNVLFVPMSIPCQPDEALN